MDENLANPKFDKAPFQKEYYFIKPEDKLSSLSPFLRALLEEELSKLGLKTKAPYGEIKTTEPSAPQPGQS